MPFRYAEAASNLPANPARDPIGKRPEVTFRAARMSAFPALVSTDQQVGVVTGGSRCAIICSDHGDIKREENGELNNPAGSDAGGLHWDA